MILPISYSPRKPKEANKTHSNLGTSETGASVETNAIATSATIDLNFPGIRLESSCSIFGGDTALNSETALGDSLLSETELG